MKRLIAIASCLFVIFAGAASAWASCEQSFRQANSAAAAHGHDHHSESHHKHEDNSVIHCPTLDTFLLTASFSQNKNDRVERITLVDVPKCPDQFRTCQLYRSLHGPPGYSSSNNTPPYLFLSVLRI